MVPKVTAPFNVHTSCHPHIDITYRVYSNVYMINHSSNMLLRVYLSNLLPIPPSTMVYKSIYLFFFFFFYRSKVFFTYVFFMLMQASFLAGVGFSAGQVRKASECEEL